MARRKKNDSKQTLYSTLKMMAGFGFIGLLAAGILLAERYVRARRDVQTGPLVFVDPPAWVTPQLLSLAKEAAGGERFYLEAGVAAEVDEGLKHMPWLHDVTVTVTPETVRVEAQWRKPLAIVKSGLVHFYVDRERVVLDRIDLPLPIVTVRGVRYPHVPPIGSREDKEDLAAAVDLIAILDGMDAQDADAPPLLAQIDTVDIGNFRGREAKQAAHIVLKAKGNTQILWGAELNAWGEYLENSDKDKLAKLYTVFRRDYDNSFGNLPLINLKDPRYEVPFPADQ